jgi:deoxyguanosine kinase
LTATLVSIIGPPASGKTTLARYMAEALGAQLVFEDFESNPFLADSYTGCDSAALPAQLYFLLSRVAQLNERHWPGEGLVVSDYGFCQDQLYASCKLDEGEYRFYFELADWLGEQVIPPSLVISLDASIATLQKRIGDRGRRYETGMDEAFLTEMRKAYNNIERELPCPVIQVDTDAVDILSVEGRDVLLAEVREKLI